MVFFRKRAMPPVSEQQSLIMQELAKMSETLRNMEDKQDAMAEQLASINDPASGLSIRLSMVESQSVRFQMRFDAIEMWTRWIVKTFMGVFVTGVAIGIMYAVKTAFFK